ncbi:hypothetical protein CPB85DRAFT_1390526 [Mucidula mucida]|nr:hypothetical protein CPB85DRAFT_1390526 [Mucidula mucida]
MLSEWFTYPHKPFLLSLFLCFQLRIPLAHIPFSLRAMISLAILSLSLALTVMGDSWGPAYSLGPTNSAIIEATTTFNPGTPPSNPQNYLFLWPGISNSTSGLIQSGADSTADQSGYCGASSDQWCVMASYFGVVDGATTQLNGDMVPVDANTDIIINYKLGDDQVTWTQTVTVNGEVISTLESYDGPLYNGGWGTGTECQSDCTGSTSPQYYTNTTIILMEADADFSSTLGVGSGVEASDMVTNDNGKTWTIASITISAMIDDAASSSGTVAAFAASSDVPSSSVSDDTSGSYTYTTESTGETVSISRSSQGSTATFSGTGPEATSSSDSSSGGFPGLNSTKSCGHGGPQGSGNGTFSGEGGSGSNSTTSGGFGGGNSTSLPSQGSPSGSLSTAASFPESSTHIAASNGSTSGSDSSDGSYSSDLAGGTIGTAAASNSFPSATFSGESPSATGTSTGTSDGESASGSCSGPPFASEGSSNSSSPFGDEGSTNSSTPFGGEGSESSSASFGGEGAAPSGTGQDGWSSEGGAFPSSGGAFGGEGGGFGGDGSNSASGFEQGPSATFGGAIPTAVVSGSEGSFTDSPFSASGPSLQPYQSRPVRTGLTALLASVVALTCARSNYRPTL